MPVFKDKVIGALEKSSRNLFERMVSVVTSDLTHDEFLNLFAPEVDRPILRYAPEIANLGWNVKRHADVQWAVELPGARGKTVCVRFQVNKFAGLDPPLLPRETNLQRDADPLAVEKVTSWVTLRTQIGRDFALVSQVLKHLNEVCETSAQMRFFWPAITTLIEQAEGLDTAAAHLQRAPRPKSLPSIGLELRAACQRTAGAIARTQLVEKQDHQTMPVDLDLVVGNYPTFDEEGLVWNLQCF